MDIITNGLNVKKYIKLTPKIKNCLSHKTTLNESTFPLAKNMSLTANRTAHSYWENMLVRLASSRVATCSGEVPIESSWFISSWMSLSSESSPPAFSQDDRSNFPNITRFIFILERERESIKYIPVAEALPKVTVITALASINCKQSLRAPIIRTERRRALKAISSEDFLNTVSRSV